MNNTLVKKRVRLSPVEILSHLGFEVPYNGVELNSDDSCLYVEALRLLGTTIDISTVPDSELGTLKYETLRLLSKTINASTFKDTDLNNFDPGFSCLVRVLREGDTPDRNQPDLHTSNWLRCLAATCLSTIYKSHKVDYGTALRREPFTIFHN